MTIKELEQELEIPRATIRFYEKEQLISPKRNDNSYREYSEEDVKLLKKIIILRKIGLPVSDIKNLLDGNFSLQPLLEKNISELQNQIKELEGAISVCKIMQNRNEEISDLDTDLYWNEIEAQETTGIRLRDSNGTLHPENMEAALRKMREFGVSTWAVIHCPEGGWGMAEDGVMVSEPSAKLPAGYIAGTVGAGDAFCSGVLLAAQKKLSLAEGIHLGAAAACASLRMPGATEGMDTLDNVLRMHTALQ